MKKIFFIIALGVVLFLGGCGKSVEIKFDSNGGSEIATIVKAGDFDPNNLPKPEKTGYEFVGWYLDSSFTTPIIGNVPKELKFTLYAKWKGLNQTVKVEHYLEDLDGSYQLEKTDDLTYPTGEVVNASVGSFTGYEQNQNHSNSVLSLTVSAISNNILKVYYQRKVVKIIIDEAGGDAVNDLTSKYGSLVTPPTLKRAGFEFDGWDQEFPTTMPANDLTITAKWKALVVGYKVEYYLENANDNNYTLIESIEKSEYTDTLVTAEDKSYTGFSKFLNHPNFKASAKVLGDASLVLKVYFNRNCYQINYLPNGGSEVNSQNVKYGANITAAVSLKTGYEFNHWYLSDEAEAYSFHTMPLHDLTLTAKWTKIIYTINFETNTEISVESITATYEDAIQVPTPPIRLGYNFVAWCEDQDLLIPFVLTMMPAKNLNLYAKWDPLPYMMVFDTDGGTIMPPITAPVGTQVEKPIPVLPGYDFINWYQEPYCINEYNDWIMPVGGIKLYAKWEVKSFTLSFETNGGSEMSPITAPYLHQLAEPQWPTKEGYLFDGWYQDSELTVSFTFNYMPVDGGVLYVKWLDEAYRNQISNVLLQKTFSYVGVKGTVFAKNNSDYRGFYLLDHSGFIYIDADHSLVNLGDLVYLEGYLNPYALIDGVSNLEVISSDNEIWAPETPTFDDFTNSKYLMNKNYQYLSLNGVLICEGAHYYLYDYLTKQKLKLDHRLYQEDIIADYLGQYILVNFVLIYDYREVKLGVITIDNSINTSENKLMITSELLVQLNMMRMFSGNSFDLTKFDVLGWAEISWEATGENASLYDDVNRCFLPTETNKLVDFLVEININGVVQSVPITIMVGPEVSIAEFYSLSSGVYHLQGIIVMIISDDGLIILKDHSGTIIIDIKDTLNFGVGDQLALTVEKCSLDSYFDYFDYQIISIQVLKTNQELNNPPRFLSKEEVKALSNSLDFFEGEYVEVRGFVINDCYEFSIEIGGYQYPILFSNNGAYEDYAKHSDYEVKLRAYLIKFYGQLSFIFMGTRGDIQIPDYSDQELVNHLQEVFIRTYAGKVFHPYEFFEYQNDPFYPATISWEMDSESAKYFNFEDGEFKDVDHIIDVYIDITITMNEASLTFRYHTTLEPYKTITATEFRDLVIYRPAFIEGIVVYRHPKYLYLLVDDDLIFVDIPNLDVYVGDRVILYGIKEYGSYYYGESSLKFNYNSNLPVIIKLISRDNSFDLELAPITIAEIYQLDSDDTNSYTRYIEVSGTLINLGSEYYLSSGNQLLLIDYVDVYTMENQLQPYLNTETTLRGFISEYYDGFWNIRFLGRHDEVASRPYSDLEKVNLIKEYFYHAYNNLNCANEFISLDNTHPYFGGQIVYQTFGDNASVIDFSVGSVQQVEAITSVDIRATITLGDVVDTFTFVINVLPHYPLELMMISEVLGAEVGEKVTFKGVIIGLQGEYPDAYYLIQDETGVIYVRSNSFYYNYSTVGRFIQVTGEVEIVRGRKQIFASENYTLITILTPSQEFIPTNYLELLNYDNYDQSNYGKPLLLTGRVVVENYWDVYLTNGDDRVRLISFDTIGVMLRKYNGYFVKVKGFYFGHYNNTDNEVGLIVAKHSNYGETVVLDLNSFDTEEITRLMENYISDYFEEDELWDFDQQQLIPYHHILPAQFTYQLLSGSEYASISGNVLSFNDLDETVEIILGITAKVAGWELVFTKTIKVKDFTLHSLDDLFTLLPGTPDIRLQATVIHLDEDYCYFLIDEKIYYLEGYYSDDLVVNSEVYIMGKKTIIDGVADYSYQIEFIYINDDAIYDLVAEPMTIAEIYANDLSTNNLTEKYLEVYGVLHYDMYLEMFYLEDNGLRIYIRSPFSDLGYFNGEEVYLKLLFPNRFVYGTYYILDYINNDDAIRFPELTIEEHLDCAINDLHRYFTDLTFYPGDYFHLYDENYYHEVIYQYSLENPLDSEFIDLENNQIFIVDEVKVIRIIVRALYDEENYQETIIEFTINPLPVSTIREVLWGERYRNYLIEGIVQGYHVDKFLIVKDDTGTIFVAIDSSLDQTDVEVGALVQIIGFKDYYRNNDYFPILNTELQLKVISLGHEVSNEALEMNYRDIIALDYLDPDSYVKYIKISGRVINMGSTSYPAYAILDETSEITYELDMIGQTYYEFNNMMNTYLDQNITVTGWLIGMEYYYFSWQLIYDSYIE